MLLTLCKSIKASVLNKPEIDDMGNKKVELRIAMDEMNVETNKMKKKIQN